MRPLLYAVVAATAAFHLWSAGVSPFTALVQRPVHLAAMAMIAVLLHPLGRASLLGSSERSGRWRLPRGVGALGDEAPIRRAHDTRTSMARFNGLISGLIWKPQAPSCSTAPDCD